MKSEKFCEKLALIGKRESVRNGKTAIIFCGKKVILRLIDVRRIP